MTGEFAISKAGHDKKKLYVIVKESDEMVWLCDGVTKTVARPKKKNIRHIQPVKKIPQEIRERCYQNGIFYDEGIKKAIKEYLRKSATISN
mgnify:FL=1